MPEFMPKVNGINSGIYNMFEVNFMIYHNIRNLREDNDWTQQYVADYLGVNRRTYSAYETGTNSMVPEILIQLSELYDTSVDYLLGLTDVQEPYPRK
jgi:transcriptional regulator with XRE-family HTH domain